MTDPLAYWIRQNPEKSLEEAFEKIETPVPKSDIERKLSDCEFIDNCRNSISFHWSGLSGAGNKYCIDSTQNFRANNCPVYNALLGGIHKISD